MSGITYVPISTETLVKLVLRFKEDYAGVIENVIDDFLERTSEDFFEGIKKNLDQTYIWDQVLLPPGTILRTKYRGIWRKAELENGQFLYEGEKYPSPAQVCNVMRGNTQNNAWLMLEVKRPNDIDFQPADRLRRR